ncbi:DUF3885 domain-containing protein [Bacillus sp. FSL R9-9497]|uniref:DUF3885 domain-containing protein n=1 Tax=Bacillus sp. FSL R9-9497 TaxID=2921692 RepID=UPI0030F78525
MLLKDYMDEHFPKLELKPSLFYTWEIGIRFELGVNYEVKHAYAKSPYLLKVYERAVSLFNTLHAPEDDIIIVSNIDDFGNKSVFKHKLKVFSPYIKTKKVLYKLNEITVPYLFPEDDEEGKYKTHRFVLTCKVSDIKYATMIKAICNQDMGIKPKILHDVFFINIKKGTIFHIYDDRGADLIAASIDSIQGIYEKYNNWILDYDREKIDCVFK